jgi:hypothetical protein
VTSILHESDMVLTLAAGVLTRSMETTAGRLGNGGSPA